MLVVVKMITSLLHSYNVAWDAYDPYCSAWVQVPAPFLLQLPAVVHPGRQQRLVSFVGPYRPCRRQGLAPSPNYDRHLASKPADERSQSPSLLPFAPTPLFFSVPFK